MNTGTICNQSRLGVMRTLKLWVFDVSVYFRPLSTSDPPPAKSGSQGSG
jgi:hypothetical protein